MNDDVTWPPNLLEEVRSAILATVWLPVYKWSCTGVISKKYYYL